MPDVKGILFDLDNTLYDRDRTFVAWAQWFVRDRLGVPVGTALADTVDLLVALDANGYGPRDAMFRQLKRHHPCLTEEVETLVDAFREQLLAHLDAVDEGTSQLLSALDRAGMPWGIVTNGSRNQLLKVHKLGLATQTSCVIVSEIHGARKPAPEIFLAAAARLGVDPGQILFVGDNPEADIVGAARVGMQTAWLRRTREWPTDLAEVAPGAVIDSLAELLWVAEPATGSEPLTTPTGDRRVR